MMRRSATTRARCATITEVDWERAGITGTMVTVIRGLIAREPQAGQDRAAGAVRGGGRELFWDGHRCPPKRRAP
jgi:hypothetical protein